MAVCCLVGREQTQGEEHMNEEDIIRMAREAGIDLIEGELT